ncbi:MAG: hypothetical protein NT126_01035 [Bacteroidetes bacterium]|nr:hypothetical protein [Bacteroidota bacterium]
MIPENIFRTVKNAMDSLRVAENELNRPTEDTVTLCACYSTRNSVNGFLHSYLLSKSSDNQEKYLDDLLDQCSKIDSQFKKVDLSCFKCGVSNKEQCEKNYCLSVDKVNECYSQANMVKQLVMEKLNLSEKDFE